MGGGDVPKDGDAVSPDQGLRASLDAKAHLDKQGAGLAETRMVGGNVSVAAGFWDTLRTGVGEMSRASRCEGSAWSGTQEMTRGHDSSL